MKNIFFSVTIIGFLMFSYTELLKWQPVLLEGKVISEKDNAPVAKVYVSVIDGEEEALTNDKGEFKIQSWQKLPLKITFLHKRFEKKEVIVNGNTKEIKVSLKLK